MNTSGQDLVEKRALSIGAATNLAMATIAWITYWYSNSEAILLDGNYSFIIFVGMGVALAVSRIKSQRTETFPLGQFFYCSVIYRQPNKNMIDCFYAANTNARGYGNRSGTYGNSAQAGED
jgi:predicted Co/Zn/Cd cation transporter (cation efflux family)